MFTLYVEDDQGRKTEVPFSPPGLSIGRDKDNNVRLNERNISRKHARVSAGNGGIFIEDLDSYNGIKINGDRIAGKAAIYLGDRIQVGDFLLHVHGESLRQRPEEITQKTQLPKMPEEVTNTEPMIVAPVGTAAPQAAAPMPQQSPMRESRPEPSFDESTAVIRLNDLGQRVLPQPTQTVAGTSPKLICIKGPMAGSAWTLSKGEVVIGRGAENDIQIDHRSMSRQHAKLVLSGQTWRIVDMGSANGTLVNGEQYAQVDLKKGDVIELGHVKLRVVWPGEPAPKVEAPSDNAFDESTAVSTRISKPRPQESEKSNKALVIAVAAGVAVAVGGIIAFVAMTPEQRPQQPVAMQQVAVPPVAQQTAPPQPTLPPAPQQTPPPPAPALDVGEVLRRANTEMAVENWDQAIRILENALTQVPGNPQLKTALDKAEMERGAKATFDAAMAAYNKGDNVSAKELFAQIADNSIYYPRAAKRSAEAKVRNAQAKPVSKPPVDKKGKPERPTPPPVEDKPEPKVAAKDPDQPAADPAQLSPRDKAKKLYDQGNQALKQNNVRGAIDLYMEATRADPKFAPPHRTLGIAHARAGNGDAAVAEYRVYLQLNPGAPEAEQIKRIIQEYETPNE